MGPGPPISKGFPKSWKFPWRSLRHWQDGIEWPQCSQPCEFMMIFGKLKKCQALIWKHIETPTNILDNINKQKKIALLCTKLKIWIKTRYYSLFLMYKNMIIFPLVQLCQLSCLFSILFKRFWLFVTVSWKLIDCCFSIQHKMHLGVHLPKDAKLAGHVPNESHRS